jgi:hypothetical protein
MSVDLDKLTDVEELPEAHRPGPWHKPPLSLRARWWFALDGRTRGLVWHIEASTNRWKTAFAAVKSGSPSEGAKVRSRFNLEQDRLKGLLHSALTAPIVREAYRLDVPVPHTEDPEGGWGSIWVEGVEISWLHQEARHQLRDLVEARKEAIHSGRMRVLGPMGQFVLMLGAAFLGAYFQSLLSNSEPSHSSSQRSAPALSAALAPAPGPVLQQPAAEKSIDTAPGESDAPPYPLAPVEPTLTEQLKHPGTSTPQRGPGLLQGQRLRHFSPSP